MSQNCDKLCVQLKTNCIAILTGSCVNIGSKDVMTSLNMMYKKPNTPLYSVGHPSSNIFARHQTFLEPHLPTLWQNCLITVYYLCQYFRCCLSVPLLATLHKNFQTNWQWANEQVFKFCWQSGSQYGHRDCFPDSSLLGDMESC